MGKYLEQLVFENSAKETFEFLEGKVNITVSNLSTGDQLEIEKILSQMTGGTAYVLHNYSLEILSRILLQYNELEFPQQLNKQKRPQIIEQARKHLETLPGSMIDDLIKKWQKLEKDVSREITGEEIDNTFFETASTTLDSKESVEESTLENEEVSEKL